MFENLRKTFLIRDKFVIGFLDTTNLGDDFQLYETMAKIHGEFIDSTQERTTDRITAEAVHSAWLTILCNRYDITETVETINGEFIKASSEMARLVYGVYKTQEEIKEIKKQL